MKKILLTGKSGFVGKNILPILSQWYDIDAPGREELDLKDQEAVFNYIKNGKFDVVLHCANPNPVKNSEDISEKMLEHSLKISMNLQRASEYYDKLIYLGSGAEYDKRKDLSLVKEDLIGDTIPEDVYGFGKYLYNEISKNASNIYNLRIFACYGPYDHDSKFIKHAINCCLNNEAITIRQNCYFDYMYVDDLAYIIKWFIENTPAYKAYNVCTGHRITLEKIALEVKAQMKSDQPVIILNEGYNKEYTADNSRLLDEMGSYNFISLEEGIKKQIEWQRGI